MKKIGLITAVMLASLALSAREVDINGDFQKVTKWKTADGWFNTDSNGRAEIIKEGERNSIRITLKENAEYDTYRRLASVPVKADDLVTIRMTASGKGFLGCGVAWTKKGAYTENDQKRYRLTSEPKEYVFTGKLGERSKKGMDGFTVTAVLSPVNPGVGGWVLKIDSVKLDVVPAK